MEHDTNDLFFGDFGVEEFWVERDEGLLGGREASGAPESSGPFHLDAACEGCQSERLGCALDVGDEQLERGIVGIGCFWNPNGKRG